MSDIVRINKINLEDSGYVSCSSEYSHSDSEEECEATENFTSRVCCSICGEVINNPRKFAYGPTDGKYHLEICWNIDCYLTVLNITGFVYNILNFDAIAKFKPFADKIEHIEKEIIEFKLELKKESNEKDSSSQQSKEKSKERSEKDNKIRKHEKELEELYKLKKLNCKNRDNIGEQTRLFNNISDIKENKHYVEISSTLLKIFESNKKKIEYITKITKDSLALQIISSWFIQNPRIYNPRIYNLALNLQEIIDL